MLLLLLCLFISSVLLWTAAAQVLQGPVDAFFSNPTHYSCQEINELVPHVSLALACDLYFQGCFTSALTPPVPLLCLPGHGPWGCSSPPASWRVPAGALPRCSCSEHHSRCWAGALLRLSQRTRLVTQGGLTRAISCDGRTLD